MATLTDVLAWVGAITGTAGLGWDVYKWRRRGADVRVRISPNMLLAGPRPETQKPICMIEVTNLGAVATTLTHVLGEHYTSFWQRLRGRPDGSLWIPQSSEFGNDIPYLLQPGARWLGKADQTNLDEYLKSGKVRLGVAHSWARKPVLRWVPAQRALKPIGAASK